MKRNIIFTIILAIIALAAPLNSQAVTESQNVKKTKALFEELDGKMKVFMAAYQRDDEKRSMEAFMEANDIATQISNMQQRLSRTEKEQIETWMKMKSKQDPGFQERRDFYNVLVEKLRGRLR